jgi:opacity protein-like surface antigen
VIKHIVIILLFLPFLLFSQQFHSNIFVGINSSQIDGDNIHGFNKFGILCGVGTKLDISKQISVNLSIQYSDKGSFKKNIYCMKLKYVEIPISVSYYLHKFNIDVGVSYGNLVLLNESTFTNNLYFQYDEYNKDDCSIFINGGYKINKNFSINIYYGFSLTPLAQNKLIQDLNSGTIIKRNYHNIFIGTKITYQIKKPKQ